MSHAAIIYFPWISLFRNDLEPVKLINSHVKLIANELTDFQILVFFTPSDWKKFKPKSYSKKIIYQSWDDRDKKIDTNLPVLLINAYDYFLTSKLAQKVFNQFNNNSLHFQMTKFPAITNKVNFWVISSQNLKSLLKHQELETIDNQIKKIRGENVEADEHDLKSIYFKMSQSLQAPIQVLIESANNCNLRCNECFNQGAKWNQPWNRWYVDPKNYGQMDIKLYKSILNKISVYNYPTLDSPKVNVFLTGMGEPFTNKNILEMVKLAKKKGFYVSFTSNLTIPDIKTLQKVVDANIDSITCSIDGFSEKVYAANRGTGHYKKVWQNLHHLSKLKKRPQVTLNYIIRPKINDQEADKFKRYWMAKGFDVHLLNLAYPADKKNFVIRWQNNYCYKYPLKRIPCFGVILSLSIEWNGQILACPCSDRSPSYRLGKIQNFKNFHAIKNSPKFQKLFKAQAQFNFKKYPWCNSCLSWTGYFLQTEKRANVLITKSVGGTYFHRIK